MHCAILPSCVTLRSNSEVSVISWLTMTELKKCNTNIQTIGLDTNSSKRHLVPTTTTSAKALPYNSFMQLYKCIHYWFAMFIRIIVSWKDMLCGPDIAPSGQLCGLDTFPRTRTHLTRRIVKNAPQSGQLCRPDTGHLPETRLI
uniref:Uncharacterized protein n=1 Tax=Strigamia maritima TaxID=126957 RepID=T1J6N2_STRMM